MLMPLALRLLFAYLIVLVASAASAQERSFSYPGVFKEAQRYEALLKTSLKPAGRSARELRADAERIANADPRTAVKTFAQVVVTESKDIEAWIGLARALLAIKSDPDNGSERYELPVNASAAAWTAYERAQTNAQKAEALWVLHEALQRRSLWRPAIDALKTSLTLVESPDIRQAYEKLLAEHGFRIQDYKVDADATQPRLCIQFSERLVTGQSDWAKYFKVDGKDPQSVTAETNQICVDGLEHGKRYEVHVRAGLPSAIGESLAKDADLAVYVRDRSSSVRATARSYVLPNSGQQGIPLVTVNTDNIHIDVYRVGDRNLATVMQGGDFQKQISSYDVDNLKERLGARVFSGELAVASRLNEDVTTAFPVAEAIPALRPGIYVLVASVLPKQDDNDRLNATQWFIVSDLGLTALNGDDGLHAFVRSLATAEPVAKASVRLIARNNEVLGTVETDLAGYARFAAGLTRGEGGLSPSHMVVETGDGDYAFLDLAAAAFDLTDRGVKGREAPGPIDAFAFTDRGVYRPGEEVHLVALVRDRAGRASGVPVTIIFVRPDGVEHYRVTSVDQGHGGRSVSLNLGASVMTGTWRIKVHADPKADPIAQAAFLVEDFVPERLELNLESAATAIAPDDPATIRIAGRYLYGPPAASLAIEGDIAVKPSTKDVPGFPGYHFGVADEQISPVRKPLEQLPSTNAQGKAEVQVMLPPISKTARPLLADIILRLREAGGRTIERTLTLPVTMKSPRIGIKPLFSGKQVGEGETAAFEVVMLDGEGKPIAATGLKWELLKLDQRWQWYSRDGQWAFEAVTQSRRAASGATDAKSASPARIATHVEWGRYRLQVSGADGIAVSSVDFNAGYWADEAADSPEILDLALDKPSYRAGETAHLRVTSRMGGKALVTVLNSGLAETKEADLLPGGGEIQLQVMAEWNPGAYVAVMLYRPMDSKAKRMPGRAIGLKWLGVDQAPRTLKVALSAPDKVKSGSVLTVPVKLEGLSQGEDARVTLTAVDVGILNLTRFESPRPEDWFFGQRRLGLEIRDLYSRLIDGMRAERGRLRSGGDGGGGMTMQGSPPVEATLALYSGIVKVGADGTARVDFQLPDFNGTVRIAAVAWSEGKIGSGAKDVLVRDPVALTVSAPRFLTLGDEARIELGIHNVEGGDADYQIGVSRLPTGGTAASPVNLSTQTIEMKSGEHKREQVRFKSDSIGVVALAVRVTGPNGIDVNRRLTFNVNPPAGDIKRVSVSQLMAKGGRLTLSNDLLRDLIPERSKVTVAVGSTASLDVPGILTALDRYPYGCAEQTVSRALPLLYVNDVARRIGIAGETEARERVQKAIERVFEMQDAAGAFGSWDPSDHDMWLTSYVTDFLTRAKDAGYSVRPKALSQALDRLQNYVSYAQDFDKGGEARAYALYVLARNGRAPIGELRYYADTRLERFATPMAQAQLAAALGMLGDKERAERVFAVALKAVDRQDDGVTRRDYGTGLRDAAALATLAVETGFAKPNLPDLVNLIGRVYQAKIYTSTQEQAWMLLAARALAEQDKDIVLTVNGSMHKGQFVRALTAEDLKGQALTIANDGGAAINTVVSVIGAALTPEPEISHGFTIERSYYTLAGKKIDLKSAAGGNGQLKQNDRLVVVLKIAAPETGGRILLVDRIPAGLAIENPRLVDSGDIKALDWLKTTVEPQMMAFRDDRFVAAFDFFGDETRAGRRADGDRDGKDVASTATLAYLVRAVTPGSFTHPAATVEDMYRPERFARTASGKLEIIASD
jgi:uncharacterized protein YfaS (alpha-2-macroglobulin family)